MNLAKEANDNGDYFPIWGNGNGMESLTFALTNNTNTLKLEQ